MCGYTEFTPNNYIQSFYTLRERIAAIDVIIMNNIALIGTTVEGGGGTYSMYELDDGQIRIKTGYRSPAEIVSANTALEKMQQMYINRLNGRQTILRARSTIRGYGFGGNCGC